MEAHSCTLIIHISVALVADLVMHVGVNVVHEGVWEPTRIHLVETWWLLHPHHSVTELAMCTHGSRSAHKLVVLEVSLVVVLMGVSAVVRPRSWTSMHTTAMILWLTRRHGPIPIVHILIILIPRSLRSVVHLDRPTIELLAIHFLQCPL